MSIDLTIKKVADVFGIRQSDWNSLFQRRPSPYYFFYKQESDLRTALRRYAEIHDKDCKWNFNDIGYHTYDSGFFGKTYYVSCRNCSKGHISGNITAEIARIKILKESADPANPKEGFFSTEVLEEHYLLWSIRLDMKCNRCDKHTVWHGLQDTDSESYWGFSNFDSSFAKCK